MPRSMTGFARREQHHPWGNLIVEIRSVNHRYLEPTFRLPDELRELEPKLRDSIRRSLQRGKVEVTFSLHKEATADQSLGLNQQRVQQLAQAAEAVSHSLNNAAPINPLELLQWPGVLQENDLDRDTLHTAVLELFQAALEQLIAHRNREGRELAQFIEQRLDKVSDLVGQVRKRLPDILNVQREKLRSKIAALKIDLDPERLEQEIALLAQKADVDEELDRLDTHVSEVKHALTQTSSLGRRLDFLMQELNREANTLSSKAVVADTTQAAVELKVLIEQMREQVQNIE